MLGVAREAALLEEETGERGRPRFERTAQARPNLCREPFDAAKVGARLHVRVGVACDQ